jgi:alkaline phosphatase D
MKSRFWVGLLLLILLPSFLIGDDSKVLSRIAFGSCSRQDRPLPIFKSINATKPEIFLHLGDIVYLDLDKEYDDFSVAYKELDALPEFQKLRKSCPFLGIWDDHDYGKNDAGVEYPKKKQSQQDLLDFLGIAKDSPRRKREGVYHSEIYGTPGKRVQVILLDGRYFRSPLKRGKRDPQMGYTPYLPNTDVDATFLGTEQWKWLEEQLKQPADVRLIGSGIQVIPEDHPFEKWSNIPAERERLFKLIRDTKANGVIFLSGDRHLAELSLLPPERGVGYPLYDVTSSGLNQASKQWRSLEANRHRVATMGHGDNFGIIDIDWSKEDPRISMQIRDVDGDIVIQQKMDLSLLKAAKKETAKNQPTPIQGALTAKEATEKVGEKVTVEMRVHSARVVGGNRILLNSEKDFRDKGNFTVVLQAKALKGKFEKATDKTFNGKHIRVSGTVILYKDSQPEIIVEEEKQLEIVEEK